MAGVLVFSEQAAVAAELLTKGRELGLPLAAALLGDGVADRSAALFEHGAARAFVVDDVRLGDFQADVYAAALAEVVAVAGATVVLLGSTRRGKELAGRLAQRLGCGAVTDATGLAVVDGRLTVQRYALGGNTVASEVVETETQVIALMPRTFEALPQPVAGEVVPLALDLPAPRVRVVERRAKPPATANIEAAERLVAVGKGLAKQEDLAIVEALAATLGAEVGCTRALASDYHWLGEERTIGISGKITKPKLMLSVGISGQIQHTVGILGAKVIVAINKDKAAPIFKLADYGIVGDLYRVVPLLTERLRRSS